MSYIAKILKTTATNQDLFMDLSKEDAESISGGVQEVFEVKNLTQKNIYYTVDGEREYDPSPNTSWTWTAYKGGIIKFNVGSKLKSYNLNDGRVYAFKTSRDGIDLYDVGPAW